MTRPMIALAAVVVCLWAPPALAGDEGAPSPASGGVMPTPDPIPAAPPSATKPAKTKPAASLIDINACSADDLGKLGIAGDVAQKIVDGRPYKAKDDLLKRGILDKDGYAKVKGSIVAKKPKK